jgi:hypothetical protein
VAERKPFLLRVDPALLKSLEKWAADDLRSLNGQIEFLLRQAVVKAGRGCSTPQGDVPLPPADLPEKSRSN